jgi:hypothetical protein
MSAPLPPLHALSIVRRTHRPSVEITTGPTPLTRLWAWLMEPMDHAGNPSLRARVPQRTNR